MYKRHPDAAPRLPPPLDCLQPLTRCSGKACRRTQAPCRVGLHQMVRVTACGRHVVQRLDRASRPHREQRLGNITGAMRQSATTQPSATAAKVNS